MKKALFQLGPGLHAQWLALSLFCIALMIADHRFAALHSLRANLEVLLYPIQYAVNAPFSAAVWVSEHAQSRETLIERNETLEQQALRYRSALQRFEALEQENQRLRALLNSSRSVKQPVTVAELLSVNLDVFRQEVLINKGSKDGSYVGQAVLDAHGIMGQLIRVTPYQSTALLITDPSHAISVHNQRTGFRAVIIGTGHPGRLEVRHVPNSADVRVGDYLLSSGLDKRFPANYPVAKIIDVLHPDGAHFAEVSARPMAHVDRSREVLLLNNGDVPSPEPDE